MKKIHLPHLLIMLICMIGNRISAHDIEVLNADGVSIYHNCSNLNNMYSNAEQWRDIGKIVSLTDSVPEDDIQLSCPDDNHPHIIDLGLPSGTKWACCNVGATKPEEYGGYYAWGETDEKDYYDWSTYIYWDESCENCQDLGSDIAGTQYDVAHIRWGSNWVMPSSSQLNELCENCSFEWTTVNGVNGGQFTGSNGGTIFLPAAGILPTYNFFNPGSNGSYWSSNQSSLWTDCADTFFFNSNATSIPGALRFYGESVRPIMNLANNINLSNTISSVSSQAIYNVYGVKVANNMEEANTLRPGIYIVNGKKVVIK